MANRRQKRKIWIPPIRPRLQIPVTLTCYRFCPSAGNSPLISLCSFPISTCFNLCAWRFWALAFRERRLSMLDHIKSSTIESPLTTWKIASQIWGKPKTGRSAIKSPSVIIILFFGIFLIITSNKSLYSVRVPGIEPGTYRVSVDCSTSWATRACKLLKKYSKKSNILQSKNHPSKISGWFFVYHSLFCSVRVVFPTVIWFWVPSNHPSKFLLMQKFRRVSTRIVSQSETGFKLNYSTTSFR